jgi:hypothetical protein
MSTIDHGVWASKVKDLARAKTERGHWPIDVGKLGVPMVNETTGGCSVMDSTWVSPSKVQGAITSFLTRRVRDCPPTWRANSRCFINGQVNLYVCCAAVGR